MKRLLLAPLILSLGLPVQAEVDPKIHKMCLQAKDYMGCVKAQTTNSTDIPSLRVIQGKTERLAVECDGDHWHGPEQHEDDISRQRDLERCGWVFWRIRESSFYRNQNSSLGNLWKILDERGIFPINNENDNEILINNKAA